MSTETEDTQEPITKPKGQAEHILEKFGGAREFMRALNEVDPGNKLNPSSIYRWTYPKEKGGTGGLIPTQSVPLVMKVARHIGLFLTVDDFYPGGRK